MAEVRLVSKGKKRKRGGEGKRAKDAHRRCAFRELAGSGEIERGTREKKKRRNGKGKGFRVSISSNSNGTVPKKGENG